MSSHKSTFSMLFMILAVMLLVLPAIITFNEVLTSLVMNFGVYKWLQLGVVPYEAKVIVVILRLFGISAYPTSIGINLGNGHTLGANVYLSWNCLGWQSFFLFLITLVTGLQGSYTLYSRIQTILIGFLGTFLMNILRISLVVVIAQFIGSQAAVIFHDYFSVLVTIAWLFVFWWFSFKYVLEKQESYPRLKTAV